MRSFGLISKIDEPFTYKEDIYSKDALRIFPAKIKDYDMNYYEPIR